MARAEAVTLSRRERLRAQTLEEIEQRAFELVDSAGVQAVSLAAIAKAMGMSAPALYRYYSSRDALVAGLVTAAYADLTLALEQAAAASARRAPEARLRTLAAAYREWALAHPKRYTMIFGERPGDVRDTAEAIATINRGMQILLAAVLDLPHEKRRSSRDKRLDAELSRWAGRRGLLDASPDALRLALLAWTRLHGIVSLEVIGVFDDMQFDAGLLLNAEVDGIVRAATAAHG